MSALAKGAVLVTGLQGFTGRYLEAVLRETGYGVFGLVSSTPGSQDEHQVDIRDLAAVTRVVDRVAPNYIIHLAAVSFVAHGDAGEIYDVNVKGTLNLIEALRQCGRPVRKLLIASSGNIYGTAATVQPVTEDVAPQPLNHYGISKLAVEHIARLVPEHIPTLVTRPFNYTGIGQADNFVVPKLVTAFRNTQKTIRLGNIDVVRDISDVRWIAQIYLTLLESSVVNETINICSGRGVRIRNVLEELQQIAGYEINVETDEKLLRVQDIPILVGSSKKLARLVKIPACPTLSETLTWMYKNDIQ